MKSPFKTLLSGRIDWGDTPNDVVIKILNQLYEFEVMTKEMALQNGIKIIFT